MANITVSSGQSSSGLTLSGDDILIVQSGGMVQGSQLEQGSGYGDGPTEQVLGSSVGTQIDYGSQTVDAGGSSLSAVVGSDGEQQVINGGTANFTTIQSAGYVHLGDEDADQTTPLAVATSDTVLSGGELSIDGRGFASGTNVSAGGGIDVQSGGQTSGDTISSGGVLFVERGGSASHETIQAGGLIVERGGAIVTDTNTSGVLAGVVVTNDSDGIISSWVQSGNAPLNNLDLSALSGANQYEGLDAIVAAGQTVNGLTLNSSMDLEIDGTVNGLTGGYVDIEQGGVLTGAVSAATLNNSGGEVSGITLTSGLTLNNYGGLAEQVTVQSGATLTVGLSQWYNEYGDEPALPPAQASGTVVQSGGSLQVLSGGSITGDTISSGGYVYLSAGASASDETIADGGILIREGNTTLSNIHGALAGVVMTDANGVVQDVFFQSGTNTLSNITLTPTGAVNGGQSTVVVANGETVNGLALGGSSGFISLNIAGTVSGLSCAAGQVTVMQGGTLGGNISKSNQNPYGWMSVVNSGGSISGAVLTSGLTLSNASGTVDGLTVLSGATLEAQDMSMTGVVVQSGGTLLLASAADIGSAGGTLDIGANLIVGQNISATQSGGALIVSSNGTVVQTYTIDVPAGGTPVLTAASNNNVYGGSAYTLAEGQLVSAGQTSTGYVASTGQVQFVYSGGTSISTTVMSGGQETVYSGGLASATTVLSGGSDIVSAGGSALGTVVSSYGSETVSAGGTASQTDVQTGGSQNVSSGGVAISATVGLGGVQSIYNGTASGTQVNGYQSLYAGQTVSSLVASGGVEYVQAGVASSTTVQSGGQIYVVQSGQASGTTIENGGHLSDTAGVTIATTVQSGGHYMVNGTPAYKYVNGSSVSGESFGSSLSTTVLSGGIMQVGPGGSASGDIISSGGYVEVQSGGIISDETVKNGGIIILDNGGTVTGTNTSGVLAGVVVRDGQGALVSAIVQSGNNTLQSLDLTSLSSSGAAHSILVASGETVENLSAGSAGSYSYQTTLSIGGVVSGLNATGVITTVLSGGVLEGAVSGLNASGYVWVGDTVINSGGTVDNVQLGSGVEMDNESGAVNGLVVASGATLQTRASTLSNVTVESGGVLDIYGTSGGSTGQNVGTLNVGADLNLFYSGSATQQGDTVLITSSGMVAERFAIELSPDAQPDETGILLGSSGTCSVTEGYVVSAGQTSTGLIVPRSHELMVEAGGTSVDATLVGSSSQASGGSSPAQENVWGSSLRTSATSAQQVVHSGGVSTDASVVSNGGQTILSGGTASGTVISDFSSQSVSSGGSAVSTTLSAYAQQTVEVGGSVTGTTLTNGGDQLLDGGSALNTTVGSGGLETLFGQSVASGTVIQSGGRGVVEAQALLEDFTVESGGQLNVYGSALHGEVKSGATLNIFSVSATGTGVVQATGTTVDLGAHLLFGNGLSGQIENDTLLLTSGGVAVESFALGNLPANAGGEAPLLTQVTSGFQTYYELDDGTPCYCPGTLIATTRGEVAVEDLKIGDRVLTAAGKRRPIRWIGNRAYSGRFAATNPDVLPVLFRAGSLGVGVSGEALPRRDLMVSPLHAMYLDGVLVPAQALVNGTSIMRLQQVDRVAYFHIELKTHDILLAEGAPAESFVDDDSRGMFHNAHEYAEHYPNERKPAVQYCAPRVEEGPQLEAIRQKLNSLPVARTAALNRAG